MAITIESVGGDPDGNDLIDYYFDLVEGSLTEYNFYDSAGTQVTTSPSPFTNGEKFSFSLGGYDWDIKDYDLTGADPGGKWKNNHKQNPLAADSDGENGTFTAQGGTVDDEKAASTATA